MDRRLLSNSCGASSSLTPLSWRGTSSREPNSLPQEKETTISVSGISSTNFYSTGAVPPFQQLGQDLQSGSLSSAQSDSTTLQQLRPQSSSASASQSDNPIARMFGQRSKDRQSLNLSAVQQGYTFPHAMHSVEHGNHHHDGGSTSGTSEIDGVLDQLGTALPFGKLSPAQGAFTTLQQDLQQRNRNRGRATSPSSSSSTSISADV